MELQEITKQIENCAEESTQEVRDCTKFKALDIMRQGDVYVMQLGEKSDLQGLESKVRESGGAWEDFSFGKLKDTGSMQLAPGTSKGSRHIIDSLDGEVMFSQNGHPCAGGMIEAEGSWTLTHPEHAHARFSKGLFAFWYQLSARLGEEVRRVAD